MVRNLVLFAALLAVFQTRGASEGLACPGRQENERRPSSNEDEIEAWVRLLGDADFSQRELARKKLREVGVPALEVLDRYHDAADHELRMASQRLSTQIRKEGQRRAVDGFLGGETTLPGWENFSKYAGDGRDAREAYSQLFPLYSVELETISDPATDRIELLDRWLTDHDYQQSARVESDRERWALLSLLVARLFDEAEQPEKVPVRLQVRLGQAMSGPEARPRLEDARYGPLFRRAVTAWIAAREASPVVLPIRVSVAARLRLEEGLKPAIRCLEGVDVSAWHKRAAIDLIARLGNEEHISVLEQHLDDTLVVYRGARRDADGRPVVHTSQLGDVALAALIFLTKQNPADYGFPAGLGDPAEPLPFTLASWPDDESRAAARRKWNEYRRPTTGERGDDPPPASFNQPKAR